MAGGLTAEQIAQMNASARPVDFEVIGGKDPEVRVKIDDQGKEAVLRLKLVIAGINRSGNDPNTGLPIYQINSQVVVGLLKSDPELKKPSVFKGGKESAPGFA